jgi:hypothetical protein
MDVACGKKLYLPSSIVKQMQMRLELQSYPFWVLALKERYPSKTETQALACFCTLDNRLCV